MSKNGNLGVGRSSIGDVARLAGVSKQTVSNVLNERVGYTEETKARVLRAMTTLSYEPRQAARTLRSRKTMQLGFHMLPAQLESHTGFTANLLQSLVAATTRRGYQLVVFSDAGSHPDDGQASPFDRLIAAGAVDGYMISDLKADDPRPRLLAANGVPFAAMGRLPSDLPPHWIDIDNVAAVEAVVDHLVQLGHRRLAFMGPDDHQYWTSERLEGFRAAMARHGLKVPDSFVYTGSRQEVRAYAPRLLRRQNRPTAVVTSNDAFGADVINAAHSVGLSVGDELAVTGFGGGPITQATHPTLTTIRIPIEETATALVDLCLQAASGTAPGNPIILPTELWRGGSA